MTPSSSPQAMTSTSKRGSEKSLFLDMAPANAKYFLCLTGLLLVSFWFQGSLDASSYSLDEQGSSGATILSSSSQRGLETTTNSFAKQKIRTPIRQDEFWLTESDAAVLPFDVEFSPPDASWGRLEPMWRCNDDSERSKKLIFVNIVRTEALEFQQLLSSYASSCRAGFVSTGEQDTVSSCQICGSLHSP